MSQSCFDRMSTCTTGTCHITRTLFDSSKCFSRGANCTVAPEHRVCGTRRMQLHVSTRIHIYHRQRSERAVTVRIHPKSAPAQPVMYARRFEIGVYIRSQSPSAAPFDKRYRNTIAYLHHVEMKYNYSITNKVAMKKAPQAAPNDITQPQG
jgi:hypothetical protein